MARKTTNAEAIETHDFEALGREDVKTDDEVTMQQGHEGTTKAEDQEEAVDILEVEEVATSSQRVSSRLKNKDLPDWSFLRGKKRRTDVFALDEDSVQAKRVKAEFKEEEIETASTTAATLSKKRLSRPASRKAKTRDVKPRQEQPSSVKVKSESKDEQVSGTSLGKQIQSKGSTRVKRRSSQGAASGAHPTSVKKEPSSDAALPVVKKEDVKPKAETLGSGRRIKDEDIRSPPLVPEVKVKAKKGKKELGSALKLELDTTSRFEAAGIPLLPFAIPDYVEEIHGLQVPRAFLANTFGGSAQATFPTISAANLLLHGYNNWAFLNDELHPLAPQVPGAPGIWIDIAPEPRNDVKRVIVRVKGTDKPPLWWYAGQYEFRISQSLTKEEWAVQTPEVKKAWSEAIVKNRWGNEVQASIKARNTLGREPTKEEVAAYKLDKRFAATDEVALAFIRGDEQFYLFTMKCIGYDDSFQRDIAQKYPAWRQNN